MLFLRMEKLNFTQNEDLGAVSGKVLCGDEGIVTFAVKMADEKTHTALVQQSVDGVNWQNVGTTSFADYLELNVEGLRANVQNVRICILDGTTPETAQYV